MIKKRTRLVISDTDPNKALKEELREFLQHEIAYTVNKTLMKTLVWILLIAVPAITAWNVVEFKRAESIKNIEENWATNDSIIKAVGKKDYARMIDDAKYEEACKKVEVLEETKADKTYVDDAIKQIEKEFDRSRQNEVEMLKRQDVMLKYLLEIKNK